MTKITKHKLSDLYTLASGISSSKDQAGHGQPFLSFSTAFNNVFLPDTLPDLMASNAKEQETHSIRSGDVFLTRTSEVVDELAYSSVAVKDYPLATFSGFLKRLRPKESGKVYPKYMALYLRGQLFRKAMDNNAVMTLRASFNEAIFSYLDVWLPDYEKQVEIGDFLFAIEEKIKVNNKINAELEAMAKLIYDYWFVQFDFPNENGKPYKSSGGKMVYNETLKRDLPEGWELVALEKYTTLQRGITYSGADTALGASSSSFGVLRATNISSETIDQENLIYIQNERHPDPPQIKKFDILLVMSSGSTEHVGKKAMYYFNEPLSYGAFCSKISPSGSHRFYVHQFLRSQYFKSYIKNQCLGTNINNLNNGHINSCPLIDPNKNILERYEALASPIYQKISINHTENQVIAEMRDWLLPMLMNGQVDLGN
ncbi:Type-1 restriction enzyme EcoKI specificity protein [Ascidiaceihabitans donghaensis]|uniref:Type-1 restriction enzyme EcoKI specificity protein n=1 Tax=Ascidiaceihabitans donghaensis TaxID=1510460 RepID=A0A2R8BB88_9RHOB|nr:restriction endonuclease subunit S [Ascidiaceihabitans donghaensis]SPH20340.1 Type-1 restriction enzyme EcoKI specificity protein [Ascidiaceihabitans donghaensis]